MENALFQDVFGKMHLSANVKSNLKNSIVSNVKVWFQTKTMEIALQSDKFVDESCLEDLEKDIIESFPGVENVDASINFLNLFIKKVYVVHLCLKKLIGI